MKTMLLPAFNRILAPLLIYGLSACRSSTPDKSAFELATDRNTPSTGWTEYNGDAARSHYSPLSAITKENIGRLKVAWTYSSEGPDPALSGTQIQCNPLMVDGILYGVSARTQVFALDAFTGKEIWKTALTDNGGTLSRGVTYYGAGQTKKIFFGAGPWLYCLKAATGQPDSSFGRQGRIDLRAGIQRPHADNYVVSNTPNTIYKNLIIVGARVAEEETALLGDVRAFDVNSGKLVWTFNTIPEEGEPGYDTWYPAHPRERLGGANCWAGMAIDRDRGLVYVPTGSAAYDFYGGNRKGNNLFANCLLALNAATGKLVWHFQFVHHDIWDRDPPAPPNLLTVKRNGKQIPAVAQVTKQGFVFVFDRTNGQPLFDIREQPFRTDAMPGEFPSATQPIPQMPAPFTRQVFTENDFNAGVADRDSLVRLLRAARTGGPYIPVTSDMTIFFPGTDGGAQWGGAAVDPAGVIYVPAKQLPVYTSLKKVEKKKANKVMAGALFINHCSGCHGTDMQGSHDGSYPSLLGVNKKYSEPEILSILEKGRGMMPSFSHLPEAERSAIAGFILQAKNDAVNLSSDNQPQLPYHHTGYNRWYDRNGYPVSRPPWGTLTAIDLNTGGQKWQVPLGEYKDLTDKGLPPTGTDNYGGPLITAGGLIFIAATRDEKFRAFDKETGKILWETSLPAAGYASASTYSIRGKQFIVIACGGGKLQTKSGDKYVAFALDKWYLFINPPQEKARKGGIALLANALFARLKICK